MAFADPSVNIEELELEPGMQVIDVGAGSGHYAILAARRVGETGKVYAVDVEQDLLNRLKTEARRERLSNIETLWGDADKPNGLKLRDASVDAGIVSNVLFFSEHKDGFAAEVLRVLKPGKKLFLIDWKDSFGGLGPHPGHIIRAAEAASLFKRHGARLAREFNAGDHHYGLLLQKT